MIACPCPLCTAWAVEEAGTAGDPWRPVLAAVTRWAELRVRSRDEDLYELLMAGSSSGTPRTCSAWRGGVRDRLRRLHRREATGTRDVLGLHTGRDVRGARDDRARPPWLRLRRG